MPWLFLPVIDGTISTTELLERQGERNAAVQVVQSVQHVRVVNPGSEAIGGRRETFVPTLLCVFGESNAGNVKAEQPRRASIASGSEGLSQHPLLAATPDFLRSPNNLFADRPAKNGSDRRRQGVEGIDCPLDRKQIVISSHEHVDCGPSRKAGHASRPQYPSRRFREGPQTCSSDKEKS